MRLTNLSSEEKSRLNGWDVYLLIKIMKEELEAVKNDLIVLPKEKLEEARGGAKVLQTLIKLLEK